MGVSRVYLVDASGSMSNTSGVVEFEVPKIELVKSELTRLLGSRDRFSEGDRVAVVAFKNRKGKPIVETVIQFQNAWSIGPNYPHLIGGISTINAEGGTPIGSALVEALYQTEQEEGDREIVLITDADYSLGEDPRLCIYDAILQNARINAVYMGVSENEMLESLTRRTGGSLRRVRRPAELHKALFYPQPPPPLDTETVKLVSEAAEKVKQLEAERGGAGTDRRSGGTDEFTGLVTMRDALARRREDLGREVAALTLERQGPLLKLTGIRQMLLDRKISKKEYLKRAAEPEERLGEIASGIAARQYALGVLGSLIEEMNALLEGVQI